MAEIILFQGDSITDCGRNRNDNNSLGSGYPLLVSALLSSLQSTASFDFTFINKGISGNRACDLQARWQEDCIKLQPNILSILIGINDMWRRYDSNNPTSVENFTSHYRNILTETKAKTNAKIILIEPFLLPINRELDSWREDLDPKIQAVRSLAREFADSYIPLDGLFAEACIRKNPGFWAQDGVHPSVAGHGLIAEAWLNAFENLR